MKLYTRDVNCLLTKSKLPDADYVINPYVGCTHKCIYCYAEFMGRFSACKDKWGDYIIVKNPKKIITNTNFHNKTILISSVTDPYNSINKKYKTTRRVLETLKDSDANIEILTKSKNILDDIDIIKKMKNIKVGISLNTIDDSFRKKIEPNASTVEERINVLKMLNKNNIRNYLFISPIFPEITKCEEIIEKTKGYLDEVCFENLNLRGNYKKVVLEFINDQYPHLKEIYNDIYQKKDLSYWENYKKVLIEDYLEDSDVKYKFYFYHDKIKK